jgi:hypothetical protein
MTDTYARHEQTPAGYEDGEVAVVPVAPGYQGALFRPPAAARPRWRAVRRDGVRLPPVAELGVVIAQAAAIAAAEGAAWIVGADHHTVEISAGPDGLWVSAAAAAPRWVDTVTAALARSSRSGRRGLSS